MQKQPNAQEADASGSAIALLYLWQQIGLIIFVLLTLLSDMLLRNWHESAIKKEP